ncbi:MAG TPA: hypothetical protein VFL59_06660 [Candidatus Nanopelagicales bacterium]|nr:hypothetical protein [Candidatus Nanopelagicales bacterium]
MYLDVMLCDHAQVAGEKLFISGANIDRVVMPAGTPPPYVVGFSAAGIVHVPWNSTNEEHTLTFELLTEDGDVPELPPGAAAPGESIGGQLVFTVGRPPQLSGGEEQNVPFAFNFPGLPLMRTGRYSLVLSLDGVEARRVPFTLQLEPSRGGFGPASIPGL